MVLTGSDLFPEEVAAVARDEAPVHLNDETRDTVRESHKRVESAVDSSEAVYRRFKATALGLTPR